MSHKHLLDSNITEIFRSIEKYMVSMGEKHIKFIEGNWKHLTIARKLRDFQLLCQS